MDEVAILRNRTPDQEKIYHETVPKGVGNGVKPVCGAMFDDVVTREQAEDEGYTACKDCTEDENDV